MFYIVYQITNKINGKFYIGVHKTTNLDDGYMGSGKYLKRAIDRYGIENFTKEILFFCNSEDDMFQKEKEIVTEELVKDKNCYNIKTGGDGGFDYINENLMLNVELMRERNRKIANIRNNENRINGWLAVKDLPEVKENVINGIRNYYKNGGRGSFQGKTHKHSTKIKIGESNKENHLGISNSQYGTCWITNGILNKKINIDNIDNLEDGWYKGRIVKSRDNGGIFS